MRLTTRRFRSRVDVTRLVKTYVGGKPSQAPTPVVSGLPCHKESSHPQTSKLPEGWIERATYMLTWIPSLTNEWEIKSGDIVTVNQTGAWDHGEVSIVKKVTRDMQGGYATAILEASVK